MSETRFSTSAWAWGSRLTFGSPAGGSLERDGSMAGWSCWRGEEPRGGGGGGNDDVAGGGGGGAGARSGNDSAGENGISLLVNSFSRYASLVSR